MPPRPGSKAGGPRKGAGRPRKLEPPPEGERRPRVDVELDAAHVAGLSAYMAHYSAIDSATRGREVRVTEQDAVRELALAYAESDEVRRAVDAWRSAR